jgi:hypothetical protein
MELSSVDHYFETLAEPERSCLLFLRQFILDYSDAITEKIKFNTPFYYVNGKWMCFISYNPKLKEIYISFVDGFKMQHRHLVSESRKKMKIFRVDANEDVDVKSLNQILNLAVKAI